MNKVEDKDILLEFLGQAMNSENTIRNTTRSTMNYYSTLLLSITGGILLISKDLIGVLFSLCFILGGICLIIIPTIAFLHFRSDYRRQIEMITIQAKLEDILGFTDVDRYQTTYWNHEPIIPPLYVSFRKSHTHSNDFVNAFIKSADMIYVRIYYLIFGLIGAFYIGYGVFKYYN